MDKTRLCELADFAFRVRRNCIRMTNNGQSGHVGSMLSMADVITVLYNGMGEYSDQWHSKAFLWAAIRSW